MKCAIVKIAGYHTYIRVDLKNQLKISFEHPSHLQMCHTLRFYSYLMKT